MQTKNLIQDPRKKVPVFFVSFDENKTYKLKTITDIDYNENNQKKYIEIKIKVLFKPKSKLFLNLRKASDNSERIILKIVFTDKVIFYKGNILFLGLPITEFSWDGYEFYTSELLLTVLEFSHLAIPLRT